jgi:hypothetical protein
MQRNATLFSYFWTGAGASPRPGLRAGALARAQNQIVKQRPAEPRRYSSKPSAVIPGNVIIHTYLFLSRGGTIIFPQRGGATPAEIA